MLRAERADTHTHTHAQHTEVAHLRTHGVRSKANCTMVVEQEAKKKRTAERQITKDEEDSGDEGDDNQGDPFWSYEYIYIAKISPDGLCLGTKSAESIAIWQLSKRYISY